MPHKVQEQQISTFLTVALIFSAPQVTKGLYGPMGTGLLIINSETTPDSLIQGGTGSDSANLNQPEILPDKYESGTPNLPGIAGLNAGIKFVLNKKQTEYIIPS